MIKECGCNYTVKKYYRMVAKGGLYMGVNVEMSGMSELLSRVETMGLNVEGISESALQAAGEPVIQTARQNIQTPVFHNLGEKEFLKPLIDKGKLLKSLKVSKPKKSRYKGTYIRIFTNDPVAHLVEFGHGGPAPAPPHPFLAPALESNRAKVQQILKDYLSEAVRNG